MVCFGTHVHYVPAWGGVGMTLGSRRRSFDILNSNLSLSLPLSLSLSLPPTPPHPHTPRLEFYGDSSSGGEARFAVIKVGGEVVRDELDEFAAALSVLHQVLHEGQRQKA